jgi:hypothetical protein
VNEETFPLASIVTYHFPLRDGRPALKLIWYDGGLRPARPDELEQGKEMGTNGNLVVGDCGKMLNGRLIPDGKRRDFGEPPKTLPRSIGHYKEWIEACKGGQPAGSNFNFAGPLAEAVLLGNVALRSQMREDMTRQWLEWDSPSLKIRNHSEANQFLKREYRDGWQL